MKNNLSYLKTGDFSTILNEIHDEIQNKMEKIKEDEKAKEIEAFLREVKQTTRKLRESKTDSAVLNSVNQDLANLIQETFNEQTKKHEKLRSSLALFQRSHTVKSIKGTDDIFEEELGYLIKAAAQMKGQDVNIDLVFGGTLSASSKAIERLTDNTEKQMINLINEAVERQSKNINQKNVTDATKIVANTGKIDISAPSFLHVEGDAQDLISRFLSLISGATFTLKNYSSFQNDAGERKQKNLSDIRIHLGDSNLYKAVTGALNEILSDSRAQKRIFYRGITVLAGKSNPPDTASEKDIFEHFAHLKFIYELRGSGLIDQQGNSKVADYIIWNDPDSDNIAVRSTASLIKQHWKSYARTLGAVSITAAKITG